MIFNDLANFLKAGGGAESHDDPPTPPGKHSPFLPELDMAERGSLVECSPFSCGLAIFEEVSVAATEDWGVYRVFSSFILFSVLCLFVLVIQCLYYQWWRRSEL